MGRIKKTASERHTATLSPFVRDFVKDAAAAPLHTLPSTLARFPQHWPLPRGDLYHWIPLLDRFDNIYDLFNREYALNDGPQSQPFECRVLQKGDATDGSSSLTVDQHELDNWGYSAEGDRELIEACLHFTRILLEHCGNRSLYASSSHISHLLNTTSLSVLRLCLKLSLRLAQRYSVARNKNQNLSMQPTLLASHYQINHDNLLKIAMPFPKPQAVPATAGQTPGKGKEKQSQPSTFNPSDLVALSKEPLYPTAKSDMSAVALSYYDQTAPRQDTAAPSSDSSPTSPTPTRRASNLGPSRDRPSADERSASTNDVPSSAAKVQVQDSTSTAPKLYQIPGDKIEKTPAWALVKDALCNIPDELHYDLLNRVRIAKAFASSESTCQKMLEIRLLAIANYAYAYQDDFQEKIASLDGEEPRRLHLTQQLCDLLQPATSNQTALTLQFETTVLATLEALIRSKLKVPEITDSLAITVNHGLLYYQLRKVMASLNVDEHADKQIESVETEWREVTFDLINSLLHANYLPRYGEKMVAAGIIEILVEALSLRTSRAERFYERVLQFFDNFIHNIPAAFQTLANAKGLDIIADLTSYEVETSLHCAQNGKGLPREYVSRVVDYSIPFYQQSALRQLFKNTVHMFDHNAGTHDRLLRNFIDTPQILGALRTVIENARVFGSNVWSGAVSIVTGFIHNEPTSYQVIGEAGLSKGLLESITGQTLPDELPPIDEHVHKRDFLKDLDPPKDGKIQYPSVPGILPVGEVMAELPNAFGAICLNEAGMQLFQASGALIRYFDIFLSPEHVRVMEEEGGIVASIGQNFDELSRHHPRLKDSIMGAVFNMLERLRQLCQDLAEHEQVGAKLWERSSDSFSVAGGRAAMKGASMADVNDSLQKGAPFAPAQQTESLADTGEDARDRASSIQYLSACFRFLEYFLHNSTMCTLFTDESGAEVILDLAMTPSIPYDLVAFPLFSSIAQVIKMMCDTKPHLVLPSLIRRTQFAILGLKDLTSSNGSESSLATFADLSSDTKPTFANGLDGTTVVKSLVNTHMLTHILGRVLMPPPYTRHASNNPPLNCLNFTDVYLDLVDSYGKLHAACLWEALLLQKVLPEDTKKRTDPKVDVMRRVDADGMVELASDRKQEQSTNVANDANDSDGHPITDDRAAVLGHKNTKAIRYLLSQVPSGVESFFFSLGQAIILKRNNEQNMKQHAALIADRIAQSLIWELDHRRTADDKDMETKYIAQILTMIGRMMLRSSTSTDKEALTLVLNKFHTAGGLTKLNEYLERNVKILEDTPESEETDNIAVRTSVQSILKFYGHIVRKPCIIDAAQTANMRISDRTLPEFFVPGQFLVELRDDVLPAIQKLWQSSSIDKLKSDNMKEIVDILRVILEGLGEDRALRRSEKATRRVAVSKPSFRLHSTDGLEQLASTYGTGLAREAMYRCNYSQYNAEHYCRLREGDSQAPRFPIPEGEDDEAPLDQDQDMAERGASSAEASGSSHPESTMVDAGNEGPGLLAPDSDSMSDDADPGPRSAAAQEQDSDLQAMLDPDDLSNLMVSSRTPVNPPIPPTRDTKQLFVTLDDLDDKRKEVRDDLVDRCLDVLSTHRNITFELSDLIQAAVAKTADGTNPRAEIGATIVSSLLSLQGDESKDSGPKIHAYAHLVALIMKDTAFFASMLDELKSSLDNLIAWVQLEQDQKMEDAPWIPTVLCILERILAEDEQPRKIDWQAPPPDDPLKRPRSPSPHPSVMDSTQRSQLLDALIDILPKIGKNSSLALSVCRVLVILTRHRDLAIRLSEKQNIGRLFMMIRQLAGSVDGKLQISFVLILRHMIEDDNTIRDIMRAEIRAAFENPRSGRVMDTSAYAKSLHHLVIRNPTMFVEVTQEMLEISSYDGNLNRAHTLALKEKSVRSGSKESAANTATVAKGDDVDLQKQTELKMPTVETTDGVVQFLLRELSNYKDVDDKPQPVPLQMQPTHDSVSADIEMGDAASANSNSAQGPPEKTDKPTFKPVEHPIYLYRCFILQCLAELLASYNRTKVEFINFSRKSEAQPATPSKPRSGTLNYLLNTLIPVGTLEHRDEIPYRKKMHTSQCAISVLVNLCSKTPEQFLPPMSMYDCDQFIEREPELTFVRKFVLDHALRAFKEATTSTEPLDLRYSRLLSLGDLFDHMLNGKADHQRSNSLVPSSLASHQQIGRLMYEKNFIGSLTSAIAELDLNFPQVAKRAVRYILSPLKQLTDLGVLLSQLSNIQSMSAFGTSANEDDTSSATSLSGAEEDEREQTPDLFRGSSLGMFEVNHAEDEDDDESDSEGDEDDEMYEGGYDEEMEYEEEQVADHGDVVSDDDDIEGMEGVPRVEMEVDVLMEDDDDDSDGIEGMDDDDEDEGDDDDVFEYGDQMDEITGDDENASMADHDEEGDWEDDGIAFDGDDADDQDVPPHLGGPLAHIAQVLGADVPSDAGDHNQMIRDGIVRIEMGDADGEFFEDEMAPEDDDEEDEEIDYDGDVVYEPEPDDDEDDEQDPGWGWDVPPPAGMRAAFSHHHHHHRGDLNNMFNLLGGDVLRPGMRAHRPTSNPRDEDGINPLLINDTSSSSMNGRDREPIEMAFGGRLSRHTRRGLLPRDLEPGIFHELMATVGPAAAGGQGGIMQMHVNIEANGRLAGVQPVFFTERNGQAVVDIDPNRHLSGQMNLGRYGIPGHSEERITDEARAVNFLPIQTSNRWQEEAQILFSGKSHAKAELISNTLLSVLVPPAMEEKRKSDKEAAERKVAEEKAAEEARQKAEAEKAEREAVEKKDREEREARERAEAEAREREDAERNAQAESELPEDSNMEDVEHETQENPVSDATAEAEQAGAPAAERISIHIRGNEVDITDLGIDRDYLEALPEEMREEVIMQQYAEHRSQAVRSGEQPTEISREFLEALPRELQQELLQSEAAERRSRERMEARRRAAQEGNNAPAQPEEMNNADFMAMLEPALRQAVLMEADDTVLAALPEELQQEARALFGDRRPRGETGGNRIARGLDAANRINGATAPGAREEAVRENAGQRRPILQMLDKAGVATLLRLMFVSLPSRARSQLHGILADVCKNTQNRAEVISILLSILQDGTADASAIERSFAQLSLRAKQSSAGPKTPQASKRNLTDQQAMTPTTDLSPLNIVQHCLGTLNALCSDNPRVPSFFLNEHETITNQKAKTPKKGKGRESRSSKFPLNALLMLLDRNLVIENTAVMESLASLLSHVTHPLTILLRRAKEAQEAEKVEKAAAALLEIQAERPETGASDVPMGDANAAEAPETERTEPVAGTSTEAALKEAPAVPKKKHRDLTPPEVPEENIRLVVNILAARECPSKTFSDTLDIIKNLSAVPGAKEVFGKELIRQAQELGQLLLIDLEELAKQIDVAQTGTDLQGMALASFSSAGSKQRKLLRVLVALDHLFDPKRIPIVQSSNSTDGNVEQKLKDDILATLYESSSFDKLWSSLSAALAAIRRRGNMVNVATILLPLIESLMVVCRNSIAKDTTSANGSSSSEPTPATQPETRMDKLFFTFTEEHRKILNELIRNNPKLMNGNLSVLAKNSKVLEFDNKRNYFSRKLHDRRAEVRMSQPTLQLSVRRDEVFRDSYRALYYKSGDEIKYGKLNIRFHGEEGVDAGGVSREWFAAMARQMFNPDYALFNPVASDRTTFHPNSLSDINTEHLLFFKFIGRIIGKALYENRVLDCYFSRAVYRRILGKSVSLKDMETLDLDYYKSLAWILENDITDVTFETFSIDVDRFGFTETHDLIPNGRNIPVTEKNKQEYVRLVVDFRLIKSVQEQLDNFLIGFHEIIPAELVSIFDEKELELLISGLPEIDVDDWKNNTEYHNYQATSPQIQWFWRAVRSFDQEEKAKLLQFVTGTSKVPLNGFKELEGMNGFAKFNIHRDYSNKEKLPSSHTCFNQLDLPEYESYEHLRHQLYIAITAGSEYFGFA